MIAVAAIANAAFTTHVSNGSHRRRGPDPGQAPRQPPSAPWPGTPGLQVPSSRNKQHRDRRGPALGLEWAGQRRRLRLDQHRDHQSRAQRRLHHGKPAGTYTFHFSDDNNSVGTGDDIVSPTVTMMVLDAENATSGAASDDWSPAVTASPTTSTYGAAITATVPLTGLTLADTRSSNSGVESWAARLRPSSESSSPPRPAP